MDVDGNDDAESVSWFTGNGAPSAASVAVRSDVSCGPDLDPITGDAVPGRVSGALSAGPVPVCGDVSGGPDLDPVTGDVVPGRVSGALSAGPVPVHGDVSAELLFCDEWNSDDESDSDEETAQVPRHPVADNAVDSVDSEMAEFVEGDEGCFGAEDGKGPYGDYEDSTASDEFTTSRMEQKYGQREMVAQCPSPNIAVKTEQTDDEYVKSTPQKPRIKRTSTAGLRITTKERGDKHGLPKEWTILVLS